MTYRRMKAFTLIELLVVISIIALLIAILLPALGAARRSASNATCLSRLRGIAIAVTAYEVENKGFLPLGHGGNNAAFISEPDFTWYFSEYIEDYLDAEDSQNTDFYLCPDSTVEPGFNARRLSYSAFSGLFLNRDQILATPNKRIRASDIKRPTEIIAIGDAAQQGGNLVSGPNFTGGYVGPYTNRATADNLIDFPETLNADGLAAPDDGYHFRFRHNANETANANFLDGHAETFRIGQVQERNFSVAY